MVGRSNNEASLYHPAAKVSIGIQVDIEDALWASHTGKDKKVSVMAEFDRHVQVVAQPFSSEADLHHDVLDMGDVKSGVDCNKRDRCRKIITWKNVTKKIFQGVAPRNLVNDKNGVAYIFIPINLIGNSVLI